MFDFGVLGLNARNRIYIRKFNPRKAIRLANNKYKTKEFLAERGIPVPETYAHITNREQLFQFDFGKIPQSFVAKPNKGSKGKGITIIKERKMTDEKTKKDSLAKPSLLKKISLIWDDLLYHQYPEFGYLFKTGSQYITDLQLKKRFVSFLDGQHTLNNRADTILVEEILHPGSGFEIFCQFGLADIRVISFNLVPIAAMIRVPTAISEGKANLALGGIALGVDIISGKVNSLSTSDNRYTKEFPDAYQAFKNFTVPFWKDILLLSSSVQYFINIGYIGIDRVLTEQGPKLLEANGRAGIEIQNITQTPLRYRMKKVEDLDVQTPEKGVQISQSLFSPHKNEIAIKKHIFLSQPANIHHNNTIHETIASISTSKKLSYMSPQVAKILTQKKHYTISLPESEIVSTISLRESSLLTGNKIELGTNFLSRYLIKPEHKSYVNIGFINPKKIYKEELQDLKLIDAKIHALDKQMILGSRLKPTNLLSEMDTFILKKGKYNPQFTYRFPSKKRIQKRGEELEKIKKDFHQKDFSSEFGIIFLEKILFLEKRRQLVKAYKEQNYDNIKKYNDNYFGSLQKNLITTAEKKLQENIKWKAIDRGKKLTFTQTKRKIREYLDKQGYNDISIKIVNNTASRIAIVYPSSSRPYVKISSHPKGRFREKELEGKLAHEIDTHLTRYMNGKKTGRFILSDGTADYLSTEEGLAIHADSDVRKRYVPSFRNKHIYQKYLECHYAQTHSFRETAEYIASISHPSRSHSGIFQSTLKIKKGIENTAYKGGSFLKSTVYLHGFQSMIDSKDREKLMIGKINDKDVLYFT